MVQSSEEAVQEGDTFLLAPLPTRALEPSDLVVGGD